MTANDGQQTGTLVSTALLDLPNRPHALYRFFDRSDVLLYVGITADLAGRMSAHRRDKPWWLDVHHISIEHHATRQDALGAEAKAIRDERPLYNTQHNEMVYLPAERIRPGEETFPEAVRRLSSTERDYLEVPAYEEGGFSVAESCLAHLDDADTERFVEMARDEAERDGEDHLDGEKMRVIRAAPVAVRELSEKLSALDQGVFELLEALPGKRVEASRHRAVGLLRMNLFDDWTRIDQTIHTLSQLSRLYQADRLRELSEEAVRDWIRCAQRMVAPGSTSEDIRTKAYEYWRSADRGLLLVQDLCHARTDTGAMCPEPVAVDYKLEDCPVQHCKKTGGCEGHSGLCMRHFGATTFSETHWSDYGAYAVVDQRQHQAAASDEEAPF